MIQQLNIIRQDYNSTELLKFFSEMIDFFFVLPSPTFFRYTVKFSFTLSFTKKGCGH